MAEARILVVEDEGIEALDLQHQLELLGYLAPEIVATGEEAVTRAKETRPDLVLMDIMLHGPIDGVTAAERIRTRFDIPVIFLTAFADERTLELAKHAEPYGYLSRPFKERELQGTIDLALYKHRMERQLRESERRLATTLRSIGDAVLSTDREGRITFLNPVAEALTGWSQAEALGRPAPEVFHIIDERSREPGEDIVGRVLTEKEVVALANHTTLLTRDGREIPIEDSAAPILGADGELAGAVLVFHDVTAKRRAQQTVQRSLLRVELLSQTAAELLRSKAPQQVVESLCRKVMHHLECDAFFNFLCDERVGRLHLNAWAGIPAEEAGRIEWLDYGVGVCGAVVRDGCSFVAERIPSNPDPRTDLIGSFGIKAYACHPLLKAGGDVLGTLSFGTRNRETFSAEDLSLMQAVADHVATAMARMKTEQETMQAKKEWEGTFNAVPDLIAILDSRHRIVRVNQGMAERLGLTSEQCVGKQCYEVVHGLSHPPNCCPHSRTCRDGLEHVEEVYEKRLGGYFVVSTTPRYDELGRMVGSVHVARDITARRQAEDALRQTKDELELRVRERTAALARANRQLEARALQLRALARELTLAEQRERRRMAMVLHDHLQQLLVGARFHLSYTGKNGDERVKKGVREIESLMDQALAVSRSLTAELNPPILQEGGLASGLEWLTRWMEEKHGFMVELTMAEGIAPLADDVRVLLFESVRELLFNSAKHARVRSAKVEVSQDRGGLAISVRDSGQGFDPAALQPAGTHGGGFGLFSIRERLELLGGRLVIESQPDCGALLTLVVPLDQATMAGQRDDAAPTARQKAQPKTTDHPPPARGGIKIRVLIVDDHPVMREGLSELLSHEPEIEVVGEAADGLAALALTERLQPDVVLMDLNMPRMDGIEATHLIHQRRPEVRVVGLTMHEATDGASQRMLAAGAASTLCKSDSSEEIVRTIKIYGPKSDPPPPDKS